MLGYVYNSNRSFMFYYPLYLIYNLFLHRNLHKKKVLFYFHTSEA